MRQILRTTQPLFGARPPRRALGAAGWACALILLTALAACGPGGQQQASTATRPGPSATPSSPSLTGTATRPKPAATPRYQLPAGSVAHKIKVGGAVGTYRTYRPASLPAGAPIVVMLNPSGGSASQTERDYHWDAEADSGHFVVAYPDWQDYAGANQIAFIPAIVAAIERHNPIDSSRVYAAGISLGGTEAYFVVCSTTIFAAIGVDSARELGTCARPAPISVIHIHGTADHIVPYHQPPLSDIPQINATWRHIDHCDAPAVTTAGTVTTSIAACPDGRTVELVTIAGAGHQWPGGVPGTGMGDPPSTALNATQVIWEFFANHHR
jgi:polyhydroxybutyrate depolymerase